VRQTHDPQTRHFSLTRFPLFFSFFPTRLSALIGGGGAPEIHVSRMLSQYAQALTGMEAYCFQAYADALEVIPTTLAENAGLNPIAIVTELRNRHALGERNAGINVRKVRPTSCRVLAAMAECCRNIGTNL
jgi:chaperonin GroEL (HSP60 family)